MYRDRDKGSMLMYRYFKINFEKINKYKYF